MQLFFENIFDNEYLLENDTSEKMTLKTLLKKQKEFSDLFFSPDNMTEEEKVEKHKAFMLALHSEVSSLADAVHYKDHRPVQTQTDRQKILYETTDVMRYCLAVLNLWGVTHKQFEDAYNSRDTFLWDRETRGLQNWSGQPVIVVDIDDVISNFREDFFAWVKDKFDADLDTEDPSYYARPNLGAVTNEEAFMLFIEEDGIRSLSFNKKIVIESIKKLQEKGYWIHLLTARPSKNLKCLYDTYYWLTENKIPYDSVALSPEKYRWLTDKPFFKEGKLVCAIDDSPKHASEYASQGITVLVPKRSYNQEVWDANNIITFDWWEDSVDEEIEKLLS